MALVFLLLAAQGLCLKTQELHSELEALRVVHADIELVTVYIDGVKIGPVAPGYAEVVEDSQVFRYHTLHYTDYPDTYWDLWKSRNTAAFRKSLRWASSCYFVYLVYSEDFPLVHNARLDFRTRGVLNAAWNYTADSDLVIYLHPLEVIEHEYLHSLVKKYGLPRHLLAAERQDMLQKYREAVNQVETHLGSLLVTKN